MNDFAWGLALLAASSAALAQPAAEPARPDPLDARAAVAPVVYSSPFAQYRPFAVQPPGPWRDVNDVVGRIGGWKVYAREAQASPVPVPAGSAAPVAVPPAAGTPAPR